MKWKDFVYREIIDYCNKQGSRTFSLREFLNDKKEIFQSFKPNNRHIEEKIRQQLQFLRDDGLLSFLDNSGHYTLRGIELLKEEKEETKAIDLSRETPEKREYIVECYVKNVMWVKKAADKFGDLCLFEGCNNSFLRDDGTRYIEVHHIIPICEGGEDRLWNLSVLCAHHHKMAHYSKMETRIEIRNYLFDILKNRYHIEKYSETE